MEYHVFVLWFFFFSWPENIYFSAVSNTIGVIMFLVKKGGRKKIP